MSGEESNGARPPVLRVSRPPAVRLRVDPLAEHAVWFGDGMAAHEVARHLGGLSLTHEGPVLRVAGARHALAELAARLVDAGLPAGRLLARALDPDPAWQLRTRELTLDRPRIMGILNLTDDSFSGDGVGASVDAALRHAEALRAAGADIIDAGAETARADRPVLEAGPEADLAGEAIHALTREGHLVSVDTYKPAVARVALEAGAEIVNDISGLTLGLDAAAEAARAGAGYVLNFSFSVPKRRPDSPPVYGDVVIETLAWFWDRLAALEAIGLAGPSVAIDPGIAFGKSHEQDIEVLRRLGELTTPGNPFLLAHSRKNFIGSINGLPPAERDLETHVVSAMAYAEGARIFRVHDVAGARRALDVAASLVTAAPGTFAPDGESWPWRAGAGASHMTRTAADKPAPPGQRW